VIGAYAHRLSSLPCALVGTKTMPFGVILNHYQIAGALKTA